MYHVAVFISHSWAYSKHYQTLKEWIFVEKWEIEGKALILLDKSIPKENPIHRAPNANALDAAIRKEIAVSNVLVCPTGMYSSYSKWISKELKAANDLGVPVIPVNPWGQERKSMVVQESSFREPVGWSKQSVINAIWQHKR